MFCFSFTLLTDIFHEEVRNWNIWRQELLRALHDMSNRVSWMFKQHWQIDSWSLLLTVWLMLRKVSVMKQCTVDLFCKLFQSGYLYWQKWLLVHCNAVCCNWLSYWRRLSMDGIAALFLRTLLCAILSTSYPEEMWMRFKAIILVKFVYKFLSEIIKTCRQFKSFCW